MRRGSASAVCGSSCHRGRRRRPAARPGWPAACRCSAATACRREMFSRRRAAASGVSCSGSIEIETMCTRARSAPSLFWKLAKVWLESGQVVCAGSEDEIHHHGAAVVQLLHQRDALAIVTQQLQLRSLVIHGGHGDAIHRGRRCCRRRSCLQRWRRPNDALKANSPTPFSTRRNIVRLLSKLFDSERVGVETANDHIDAIAGP